MTCKKEPPVVTNNKDEVPLNYYLEQFAEQDPAERAKELGVRYEDSLFHVEFYGTAYQVRWPDGEVFSDREDALALRYGSARILLMRYIVDGKAIPGTGKSLPFHQLPWGAVYQKTFEGRCIKRLAWKFGTDIEAFRRAAEKLDGKATGHGDASYEFPFVPGYTLEIIIWEGDDEFPPGAQVLYSDNFALGFTAEDNVVVADLMITALGNAARE